MVNSIDKLHVKLELKERLLSQFEKWFEEFWKELESVKQRHKTYINELIEDNSNEIAKLLQQITDKDSEIIKSEDECEQLWH